MTRDRAKELAPIITAYAEGKDIEFMDILGHWTIPIEPVWGEDNTYRIKPSPATRPMTRDEVLGFLANRQGIVVHRPNADPDWQLARSWNFDKGIEGYEYAIISPEGIIGEAHRFEKEVEE